MGVFLVDDRFAAGIGVVDDDVDVERRVLFRALLDLLVFGLTVLGQEFLHVVDGEFLDLLQVLQDLLVFVVTVFQPGHELLHGEPRDLLVQGLDPVRRLPLHHRHALSDWEAV